MFAILLVHIAISGAKACSKNSNYDLRGNLKTAINPYNEFNYKNDDCACQMKCWDDDKCNGYSTDTFTNMCFHSECNNYTATNCSTCYFASKKTPISNVLCAPYTPMPITTLLVPDTTMTMSTTIIHSSTVKYPSTVKKHTTGQTPKTEIQSTSKKQTTIIALMPNITKTFPHTVRYLTTMNQSTTVTQLLTMKYFATKKQTTTEKYSTSKEKNAAVTWHTTLTSSSKGITTLVPTTARHPTTLTQPTNGNQYTTGEKPTTEKQLSTSNEQHTAMTLLTTLTSTSNSMTISDTTQNAMNSTLCVCVCKYANHTLEESIEKRRRELVLNKTELSSYIRKRMSAPDTRKTSRVVGTGAAIFLVVYGLSFFCADICTRVHCVIHRCFTKTT